MIPRRAFCKDWAVCYSEPETDPIQVISLGEIAMAHRGTSLAITLAILIAFWLIWSRLRIIVFV